MPAKTAPWRRRPDARSCPAKKAEEAGNNLPPQPPAALVALWRPLLAAALLVALAPGCRRPPLLHRSDLLEIRHASRDLAGAGRPAADSAGALRLGQAAEHPCELPVPPV